MNTLSVHNLYKRYNGKAALTDINFSIEKGTIVGLLGPNGAGKTTLIRSITKIIEPDSGALYFEEQPIRLKTASRFGYLPEERGLYKKMKVLDQLMFLARLKGLSRTEATSRIDEWMERFDIQNWKKKKLSSLSKGMQQKIQFIAAVLHEPDLIILDEPFSGFDPVNTSIITDEILRLKNMGKTIIFSTHRMESIEELCDHILLINKSRLILKGKTSEIRNQYRNQTYLISHAIELQPSSANNYQLLNSHTKEGKLFSLIKLQEDSSIKEVIEHIWATQEVYAFEEQVPKVRDIFLEKVKEASHE